jgi:hypothetical protein
LKLQRTRLDLVRLQPMVRQIAARGPPVRWRSWLGVLWHAARGALYGFGCGLPLTSRAPSLAVRRTAAEEETWQPESVVG